MNPKNTLAYRHAMQEKAKRKVLEDWWYKAIAKPYWTWMLKKLLND